jgi:hypothetical protein
MESIRGSLSEDNEQERLMKAELSRELADFEEAERLLRYTYSEGLEPPARRILELVKERNPCVAQF